MTKTSTGTSTKSSKRTDIHRPGAIIPAHYTQLSYYSLAGSEGGYPMPRMHVDCTDPVAKFDHEGRVTGYDVPTCPNSGRCCVASIERHAERDGRAIFGRAGKCGVCGAHFRTGSTFRHDDGAIVHMGHDCADKYKMMYDLSACEIEVGRLQAAHGKAIARAQGESQRRKFLDAHPGLEAALALGKPQSEGTKEEAILLDMAGRLVTWRDLSEKQVTFALKLADKIRNPTAIVEERHCSAPFGKGIEFEGEIVSCKMAEGFMGGFVYKMTVKVTTADGSTWLAYGTCPSSIADSLRPTEHWGGGRPGDLRGRRIAIKASLELPRQRNAGEDHFVFMSRPSANFSDIHGPIREVVKATKPRTPRKPKAKEPKACIPCQGGGYCYEHGTAQATANEHEG